MEIDISVITIVKNNVSGISRTIDSITRQTNVNIEHVIIDGDSTDGTLDVINLANQPRNICRLLVSEADDGIYDALNKGISRCKGDLVAILHSGDTYVSDNTLQEIVEKFRAVDSVDFLYGDAVFVNETCKVFRYYKSYNNLKLFMNFGLMPAHTSLVVRKSVFHKIGSYKIKYKVAGDYDFFVRLCLDKTLKGIYLKAPLVAMLGGGASTSGIASNKIIFCEKREILRENNIKFGILRILARYFFVIIEKIYLFLYLCNKRYL
jgi:glycosyltransferase involved in cell wall biosynthesis